MFSRLLPLAKTLIFKPNPAFSLYNTQISEKYGQKCCRYNQNGKPMSENKAKQTYSALKDFLIGWKLISSSRRLIRLFYFEDYPLAIEFLREIAKIDCLTTRNCPSFHVEKGELLKLELYSASLDGLSQVDFELAMRINGLKLEDFSLIEISDEGNYKDEVKQKRFERESKKIQKELQAQEGKISESTNKTNKTA